MNQKRKIHNTDAEPLLDQARRHLGGILAASVEVEPWPPPGGARPASILANYGAYRSFILGRRCLLLVAKRVSAARPLALDRAAWAALSEAGLAPLFVFPERGSGLRQRLIARGLAFVVPGVQAYLLPLGMDRHRAVLAGPRRVDRLSPCSQVVVLKALECGSDTFGLKSLGGAIGYSDISISRAMDELEARGLARCRNHGRRRVLMFERSPRNLWFEAKSAMRSPIVREGWVAQPPGMGGQRAGLEALREHSDCGEALPAEGPVLAISESRWKEWLAGRTIEPLPGPRPGATLVQAWSYRPELLAHGGRVDPFSLYLSLQERPDEGIRRALGELEERLSDQWRPAPNDAAPGRIPQAATGKAAVG